jgi:hypothetical protein
MVLIVEGQHTEVMVPGKASQAFYRAQKVSRFQTNRQSWNQ